MKIGIRRGEQLTRRWHAAHRRHRAGHVLRPLGLALSLGMLAPLITAGGAEAAQEGLGRPEVQKQRVSKVRAVDSAGSADKARGQATRENAANTRQAAQARTEQSADKWPEPGQVRLPLARGKSRAVAGGLPMTVAATAAIRAGEKPEATVAVLGKGAAARLGIVGVVLTAKSPAPGNVDLSLDYGAFAAAVGGGWAGRLELVRLPDCALTTPERSECREPTRLGSSNNTRTQTVSARVPLAVDDHVIPQVSAYGLSSPVAYG